MAEKAKLEMIPIEGMDLGNGIYKTAKGTVRIPKSMLKKQQPKKEHKEETKVNMTEKLPRRVHPEEQTVVFSSALGKITGKYYPVIDAGDFVVLGLTEQSFVPVSYKENKELMLSIKADNIEADIVYSGCKFQDPETEREYIVLIKM